MAKIKHGMTYKSAKDQRPSNSNDNMYAKSLLPSDMPSSQPTGMPSFDPTSVTDFPTISSIDVEDLQNTTAPSKMDTKPTSAPSDFVQINEQLLLEALLSLRSCTEITIDELNEAFSLFNKTISNLINSRTFT